MNCINCNGNRIKECIFCPFPNKKYEKEIQNKVNNEDKK